MTDPISRSSSRHTCETPNDDAAAAAASTPNEPNACLDPRVAKPRSSGDAPPPPAPTASTDADIASAARHASAARPRPGESAGAFSNAARTTERDVGKGAYAASGRTHDGGSVFAGVAAVKGSTRHGVEGELASVSVQVGRDTEVQAGVARVGVQGAPGGVSVEALTVNAHLGVDNADGSLGLHVGATATVASIEATAKRDGWSVTAGLSAGAGGEGHLGVRDDDGDGKPEACVRLAIGPIIVGGCVELPFVARP